MISPIFWIVSTVKTSRLTHFCSKVSLHEKNPIFLLLLIYEKSLDPKESSRCFLCVPLGFIVSKEIISCPHFSPPTPASFYLFDDSLLNYLSKSNRKLECKYYDTTFTPFAYIGIVTKQKQRAYLTLQTVVINKLSGFSSMLQSWFL